MPRFLLLPFLVLSLFLSSCGAEKVCSGLNPVTGTFNSNKKLRKGGRSLKSNPERLAHKHRIKANRKKSGLKSHSAYSGKGFLHIHFGGGHHHRRASEAKN